jgi:hypothetical protein
VFFCCSRDWFRCVSCSYFCAVLVANLVVLRDLLVVAVMLTVVPHWCPLMADVRRCPALCPQAGAAVEPGGALEPGLLKLREEQQLREQEKERERKEAEKAASPEEARRQEEEKKALTVRGRTERTCRIIALIRILAASVVAGCVPKVGLVSRIGMGG